MLMSLSVDKILLLRYLNWFTDFRGLELRVKIAPFFLNTVFFNTVLLAFT